jgi:hypothetical protein
MEDSGQVDQDGNRIFREVYKALDVEQVKDAAKAAAPYFAPRLSTVETIAGLSDEQLDEIIKCAAAEAEDGAGDDGEGEEDEATEPSTTSRRIRFPS